LRQTLQIPVTSPSWVPAFRQLQLGPMLAHWADDVQVRSQCASLPLVWMQATGALPDSALHIESRRHASLHTPPEAPE
jgi:hypothetical protein